ncbi:MAG: hypothetical protein ACYTF7_04705 [Planctomycetota bacterium]
MRDAAQGRSFTESLVEPLELTTFADGRAVVTTNNRSSFKFSKDRSKDLGELFKQAIGRVVDVSIKLEVGAPKVDMQSLKDGDRKAMEHPLVKSAQELFNAEVVEIQPIPSKPRKAR